LSICFFSAYALSGKLTMGVIPTIAPYLLPTMLKGIHTEFSELKLYLRERITSLHYDELISGIAMNLCGNE
jgi:LysR family hydrogen peroxide-inducible transcriptional activator